MPRFGANLAARSPLATPPVMTELEASVQRLAAELRRLRYPAALDLEACRSGHTGCLLPALHYICLGFSKLVARWLLQRGHELHSKTDARFVDAVWRLCREEFACRPALTPAQFLTDGSFALPKVLLCTTLAAHCKEKHNTLLREQRLLSAPASVESLHTALRARAEAPGRRGRGSETQAVAVVEVTGLAHRVERAPLVTRATPPAANMRTPREEDASMLQRRLAEAERVIAAQAAAIAHLESRLHSLELSSRPQSRVEVSPAAAVMHASPGGPASQEQDLARFITQMEQHLKQTQSMLEEL